MIAHNLLRASGTLAGGNHAVARGATLRRDLINVPVVAVTATLASRASWTMDRLPQERLGFSVGPAGRGRPVVARH